MNKLLELSPELIGFLKNVGITRLNDTQTDFYDFIQTNFERNIIYHAPNGSGKTVAYSLLALSEMMHSSSKKVLIIVPCRELAFQVHNFFMAVIRDFSNVKIIAKMLIGGLPVNEDKKSVENLQPNLIIGTSGRILHLVKTELIILHAFDLIVFDEYDKLFENKEFIHILKLLKRSRSLWLKKTKIVAVSATPVPQKLKKVGQTIHPYKQKTCGVTNIRNSPENNIEEKKIDINLRSLRQYFYTINNSVNIVEEITSYIKTILKKMSFKKCIIFYNDKVRGDELWHDLKDSLNIGEIVYFHSDLLQSQRLKLFHKFKHYDVKLAVTTDVLSRGLDFDNIDLVINYDIPFNIETYFHRVGRCGRNGNQGASILFLTNKTKPFFFQNSNYLVNLEELRMERIDQEVYELSAFLAQKESNFLNVNMCDPTQAINTWEKKKEPGTRELNFNYYTEEDPKMIEIDKYESNQIEIAESQVDFDKKESDIFDCLECLNTLRALEENKLLTFTIKKFFNVG